MSYLSNSDTSLIILCFHMFPSFLCYNKLMLFSLLISNKFSSPLPSPQTSGHPEITTPRSWSIRTARCGAAGELWWAVGHVATCWLNGDFFKKMEWWFNGISWGLILARWIITNHSGMQLRYNSMKPTNSAWWAFNGHIMVHKSRHSKLPIVFPCVSTTLCTLMAIY